MLILDEDLVIIVVVSVVVEGPAAQPRQQLSQVFRAYCAVVVLPPLWFIMHWGVGE